MNSPKTPELSVLLVVHNMRREASRTIFSALPPYQKGISLEDYEVLILENGSSEPLEADFVESLPKNVRYLPVPEPSPSPGHALNWGARQARSPRLLFLIDGARILSDRLVERGLHHLSRAPEAFVYTLGWHLGPSNQTRSIKTGYSPGVEDTLLKKADWQSEPDRLFDISTLAGSCAHGPFRPIAESNAFFVGRELFERMGGYDERFQMPGGSLCNLELFERYATRENAVNILLLSEATFHQVHGGAATSNRYSWDQVCAEYQEIFGRSYRRPAYDTLFADWPRTSGFHTLFPDLPRTSVYTMVRKALKRITGR